MAFILLNAVLSVNSDLYVYGSYHGLSALLKQCMNKTYIKNITTNYVTGQWQLPQRAAG